jgi:hypothetical protein
MIRKGGGKYEYLTYCRGADLWPKNLGSNGYTLIKLLVN